MPACFVTPCRSHCFTFVLATLQGGGQAQQAAFVAALVKNMYNADAANKPWAELTARYLMR